MPARTGAEYIQGLQEHPREVWIDGERVEDVTTHPGLRNGVLSVAALYDMQHDPVMRRGDDFCLALHRPRRRPFLPHPPHYG